MNILFIKHFFVGFMVSEIPRVSVLGYFHIMISNVFFIIYLIGSSIIYSIFYWYIGSPYYNIGCPYSDTHGYRIRTPPLSMELKD